MKYLLTAFLILLFPIVTFAHPGRTDAKGGHTCKTNCENWGLKYGQYHFHNSVKETIKPAKTVSKTKSR